MVVKNPMNREFIDYQTNTSGILYK